MSSKQIWNDVDTITELDAKTETGTYREDPQRHTDADSLRRHFGMAPYDEGAFDYPSVVPGCLKHARDNSAHSPAGGTDFMAFGKPGCGKSTQGLAWAIRLLEVNNRPDLNEAVIWRASESRSEWVPLAPWAKVCLPASCKAEATLESTDPDNPGSRDVELEDVAREVVYYEDPEDLFENHIDPGKFHVVYPDPQMTGCQEIYEDSPKKYDLEFSEGDPVKHWWVAAALYRVENGPYHVFISFVIDEIGDIISQDASKDQYSTYEKVLLFRDLYVDGRKYGVSFYTYGHSEADVHEKVRRKVRWHITMNGIANPTRASQVVGASSVPMDTDLTSHLDIGECLMWTETNFCWIFSWEDIPKPTTEELTVSLVVEVPKDPANADADPTPDAREGDEDGAAPARTDGGDPETEADSSVAKCDDGATPGDENAGEGGGGSA